MWRLRRYTYLIPRAALFLAGFHALAALGCTLWLMVTGSLPPLTRVTAHVPDSVATTFGGLAHLWHLAVPAQQDSPLWNLMLVYSVAATLSFLVCAAFTRHGIRTPWLTSKPVVVLMVALAVPSLRPSLTTLTTMRDSLASTWMLNNQPLVAAALMLAFGFASLAALKAFAPRTA